jgi:hypothetical protein
MCGFLSTLVHSPLLLDTALLSHFPEYIFMPAHWLQAIVHLIDIRFAVSLSRKPALDGGLSQGYQTIQDPTDELRVHTVL